MRVIIFIDGTWLWHNMMAMRAVQGPKIDLSKLPNLLIQQVCNQLELPLEYIATILCASIPINTHSLDARIVSKRRHFFEVLQAKCGYTVELFEIDFRGRRLLKQDREFNDNWEPKEKCVDIATASNIFFYANQYDLAIVVTGDRDFLPALTKIQVLGKQIAIASFENSCSQELIDLVPEVIWIDTLLSQMILE